MNSHNLEPMKKDEEDLPVPLNFSDNPIQPQSIMNCQTE